MDFERPSQESTPDHEPNKPTDLEEVVNRYREAAQWDKERPTQQVENLGYLLKAARIDGGDVFDVGAGFGRNSLHLAKQGFHVKAVEIDEGAIPDLKNNIQRHEAIERVEIVHASAHDALQDIPDDSLVAVIDSGMSHYLADEDKRIFFETTKKKLKGGGFLTLLHFSENEPSAKKMGRSRESLEALLGEDLETVLDWKESVWTDNKTGDKHSAWTVTLRKKGSREKISGLIERARKIKEKESSLTIFAAGVN